uniref:Nuclear RNA export factor Tap RNA-binding domain-containing protein n=1 Tax=Canis lupus familiaris TaxID=9615 RepID=A0A8I3S5C9_CANLF
MDTPFYPLPHSTVSTFQPNNSSVKWHNECQDRAFPERDMENKQDGNSGGWFRIPYGIKYNKTWIINSIQSHCSVPFTVVDFHYLKDGAQFFIQDACAASALKDINCKISDEENQKLSIHVSPSAVPYSVQNKLDPEEMEQLKLTMSKHYDISQKALDLHKLRFDPELMDHDMDIILNRRNCMAATLQVIKENFPELLSLNLCKNKLYQLDGLSDIVEMSPTIKSLNLSKNESVWELCKIKGLKLEELWLKGNPLCNTFPNQYTYVRSVVTFVTPPRDLFTLGESYKGSEILKNLILQFLLQNGLEEYFKDSRDIKKVKDPVLRVLLLKHTKYDIVDSLNMLPKTQHDLNSFVVDLSVQTVSMGFLPWANQESQKWVGAIPGKCCIVGTAWGQTPIPA